MLAGVATTFETRYAIDRFDQVIAADAFDPNFASGRNVRLLVHHADRDLLATTNAGTLRLRADARRITFERTCRIRSWAATRPSSSRAEIWRAPRVGLSAARYSRSRHAPSRLTI